ncbi:hypothetical protein DS031_04080 [Bacillus taeanensis]|uniref:Uncharacterized protein n=2 Tax=Bacillus taeanensis TaxID=273032 RepID=A0A366Y0Y0_9BACI|nr:hypothetical protein DS031_04080 [Bacillus taeanensis]
MFSNNKKETITLLNREDLEFATLFLLENEINKLKLRRYLNDRNQIALEITKEILSNPQVPCTLSLNWQLCDYSHVIQAALKWIITSNKQTISNFQYIEVIDSCSSLLTSTYKDENILPYLCKLIFSRYKQDLPYHYLTRAFFEAKESTSLLLIAERLTSNDLQEVKFAKRILAFIPELASQQNGKEAYNIFYRWFQLNNLFLYYTGESFDTSHFPTLYTIALHAKYLGKPVFIQTGEILESLTEQEKNLLNDFYHLEESKQSQIANYSNSLRIQHFHKWRQWLEQPLEVQLEEVKELSHD